MSESKETLDPELAQRVEEHLAVFQRGVVDLIEVGDLRRKLARSLRDKRPLRIKFGMDPSSADLHVGHAVQLRKLRDLQDLGHTIVLIVGEATALVGDPSGRNKLRPQLTREDVKRHMASYAEQAQLVLDIEKTEVRYNSEWFDKMSFEDVLKLLSRMTVARMMERDTFQKRMQAQEPVGIHELLYPLMQGWDSVEIQCDVELGATDQLFNILVGRQLQEQTGQERQVCLTQPLINGLDGRKMSKSYGNAIGLTDAPNDMFGKCMSIEDEAMGTWFLYLTRVPENEIAELLRGHPRDAKARLASELTSFFHGSEAAASAAAAFDRQFKHKQLPDDIPTVTYDGDWEAEGVPLFVLLRTIGLAKSGGEARRLIEQGGVRLDGEVSKDPNFAVVPPEGELLVQVGKRRFARVQKS